MDPSIQSSGSLTPTMRPLLPKNPNDFYVGNVHFSDAALALIACCGLYTLYHPYDLQRLFTGGLGDVNRPELTHDADLATVTADEIRAAFFKMKHDGHGVYARWNHRYRGPIESSIEATVRPLVDGGLAYAPAHVSNDDARCSNPIWREFSNRQH